MAKESKGKSEASKANYIKGKITEGYLKGQQFEINFGETPAETRVIVGGTMLNCFTKVVFTSDGNKGTNSLKLEVWHLPEDIDG